MQSPVVFPPLLHANFAEHEPLATRIRRETATAILATIVGTEGYIEYYKPAASIAVQHADALLARLAETPEVPS